MAARQINLPSIRWPVQAGQGWPIWLAADSVELPSLATVVSATIRWKCPGLAAQTRDLVLNTATRTTTLIQAVYVFLEADLAFLAMPAAFGYVTMVLDSGARKETNEIIILPFHGEFK